MALIIIGIIVMAIGGLLLRSRSKSLAKLTQLKTTESRTLGDLQEVSKGIADEMGAGSFQEFVELRGVVECAQPLVSQLTKTECVHYRMSVSRSYEAATAGQLPKGQALAMQQGQMQVQPMGMAATKGYPGQMPQAINIPVPGSTPMATGQAMGKPAVGGFGQPVPMGAAGLPSQAGRGSQGQPSRQSESVVSRRESCIFTLRDDTGTIEVNPDGAEIESQRVLDLFESEAGLLQPDKLHIGYGAFSYPRPNDIAQGQRTLGYDLEEWVLPLGKEVYVMGEVSDKEGRLMVHKPAASTSHFVITTKSKSALMESVVSKAKTKAVAAIITLGVGGILFVIGLIGRL